MSRHFGCLGTAALIILVMFVGCTATAKGDNPVPDVSGYSREQAEIVLRDAGLRLGNVEFDEKAKGSQGVVIRQKPAADELTVEGARVHITISGPDLVLLPYLIGETENDARRALEDAGLKSGRTRRVFDDRMAVGEICGQDPADDFWVPRGTKITLLVSKGPESAPVPPVLGMWDTDAKQFVYDIGFRTSISREYDRYQEGMVVDQDPSPGTDTKLGETVDLTVSKGAAPIEVPDVRGMDVGMANSLLRRAGLSVREEIVRIAEDRGGETLVERQFPHAGTRVPEGSGVTLVAYER